MEQVRAQHLNSDSHKEQLGKGFELVDILDLGLTGVTHLKPGEKLLKAIFGETAYSVRDTRDNSVLQEQYSGLHPEMEEILVTGVHLTEPVEGTTEPPWLKAIYGKNIVLNK